MSVAVIADIVGSRRLPDREAAQRELDAAIARVESDLPVAVEGLRPTVGDEQQGRYPSLNAALASLLLLQLALPDGLQCRFGIGIGAVNTVDSARGALPEGPGWWAAREAINEGHALQTRAAPSARTWIVADSGEHESVQSAVTIANAYLLARDELVASMSARTRRLTYGRCTRLTQSALASSEGISQSAVSQALSAAGARAVIEGFRAVSKELPA